MTDIAISVENLGKKYKLGSQKSGDFRESFARFFRRKPQTADCRPEKPDSGLQSAVSDFWALKDVSFEIKQGEAVGIIGRNGAGKSTLLKILSRITEPTKGRFEIFGRVSSLLEVGTGFHEELTGRENVYLNGTILGMRRTEVKAKFDEIVDFSGVEKFIDTPVKHYSSGMKVRLAFAVAAHLEPEILIIDEVLAVGDAEFQKKCLGKMEDVTQRGGRTVLFVSHNMGAVRGLCSNGIWLKNGVVKRVGGISEIINEYLNGQKQRNVKLSAREDRKGSGKVRITDISLSTEGLSVDSVLSGMNVEFKITYESYYYDSELIKDLHIGLAIYNSQQQFVTVLNNKMSNYSYKNVPLKGCLVCNVPSFPLMNGQFSVVATLLVDGDISDKIENAIDFSVSPSDFYQSGMPNTFGRQGVYIPQSWKLIANYEQQIIFG